MGHANGMSRLQIVRLPTAQSAPAHDAARSNRHGPAHETASGAARDAHDSGPGSADEAMQEAMHEALQEGKPAPKRIGILIFEDFSLVEVSSISEVFSLANEIYPMSDSAAVKSGAGPDYALLFLSSDGGSVASSCSMRIWTESLDTRWMSDCDALFIAGGEGAQGAELGTPLLRGPGRGGAEISVLKADGGGSPVLAGADPSLPNPPPDFEGPSAA